MEWQRELQRGSDPNFGETGRIKIRRLICRKLRQTLTVHFGVPARDFRFPRMGGDDAAGKFRV